MRRTIPIAIVSAGLILALSVAAHAFSGGVARMTAAELNARLSDPDVIVVDVSRPGHWKDSDIMVKGAVRENPYEVETWKDKYPKEKTLVLYCA